MRARPTDAAVALILAAVFWAGCGGSGDEAVTGPVRTTTAPVETTMSGGSTEGPDFPGLTADFAVFRGAREPVDEVPRGLIPRRAISILDLDLGGARHSRLLRGGSLYLVPAPGLVCLYGEKDAVGSCWQRRTVRDGWAVATTLCGPGLGADRVVTFGVLPDGVREVTILRSNVPDLTVPVRGNVFAGWTSSEPPLPLHVAWSRGGEKVVRSAGIPPKVAREGC